MCVAVWERRNDGITLHDSYVWHAAWCMGPRTNCSGKVAIHHVLLLCVLLGLYNLYTICMQSSGKWNQYLVILCWACSRPSKFKYDLLQELLSDRAPDWIHINIAIFQTYCYKLDLVFELVAQNFQCCHQHYTRLNSILSLAYNGCKKCHDYTNFGRCWIWISSTNE